MGIPTSAIQVSPVCRRWWRRRCSWPSLVTTSSHDVASRSTAVVIRPPRGPVNSLASGSPSVEATLCNVQFMKFSE